MLSYYKMCNLGYDCVMQKQQCTNHSDFDIIKSVVYLRLLSCIEDIERKGSVVPERKHTPPPKQNHLPKPTNLNPSSGGC